MKQVLEGAGYTAPFPPPWYSVVMSSVEPRTWCETQGPLARRAQYASGDDDSDFANPLGSPVVRFLGEFLEDPAS